MAFQVSEKQDYSINIVVITESLSWGKFKWDPYLTHYSKKFSDESNQNSIEASVGIFV